MQSNSNREIVRRLAARIAVVAQQPIQQEKITLWTALNDLKPQRPMLWITEIPWGEFEDRIDALQPVCTDERYRSIERQLRRKLFVAENLPCDEVVENVFRVGITVDGADFGPTVDEQRIEQGLSPIQSHHYEPVIRDVADIEKIQMPRIAYDAEATARNLAFHEEIFGDLLPVRPSGVRAHFFNAWDRVVRWTGVTEALIDLCERPEYIHALMRRYTDAFLSRMDQFTDLELLDDPRPAPRVGSGGAGYTSELPQPEAVAGRWRPIDQWGGATPQIFSEVSPAMHDEFALRYEMEVMERCGLNYYGCCEPLHNKMGILEKAPRLRKISISPWCDVAKAAAEATRAYVFSHKPSPAILAEDRFDGERAEQDIRDRLARSDGMPCEFIMKDISTVRGDVRRVIDWCRRVYGMICA